MIAKGLKAGDIFEDGGLFYVVDKVVGSNYVSHNISAEEKQAIEAAKEPEGEPESEPESGPEEPEKKKRNTRRGR